MISYIKYNTFFDKIFLKYYPIIYIFFTFFIFFFSVNFYFIRATLKAQQSLLVSQNELLMRVIVSVENLERESLNVACLNKATSLIAENSSPGEVQTFVYFACLLSVATGFLFVPFILPASAIIYPAVNALIKSSNFLIKIPVESIEDSVIHNSIILLTSKLDSLNVTVDILISTQQQLNRAWMHLGTNPNFLSPF